MQKIKFQVTLLFLVGNLFGQIILPADISKNYSQKELLEKIKKLDTNIELKKISRKNDDGSQGYLIFFSDGQGQKIKYQTDVEEFFEIGENTKSWLPILIDGDSQAKPSIEIKELIKQIIEKSKSSTNWIKYGLILLVIFAIYYFIRRYKKSLGNTVD